MAIAVRDAGKGLNEGVDDSPIRWTIERRPRMFDSGVNLFKGAVWAGHPMPVAVLHLPSKAQAQDTFLKGLLETPWKQGRRNPADWALSILVHAVIVCGIVIVPLLFTQVIDLRGLQSMLLITPRPPAAAPPPAPAAQRAVRPMAHLLESKALTAPTTIPRKVELVRDEAPPDPGMNGVIGGV